MAGYWLRVEGRAEPRRKVARAVMAIRIAKAKSRALGAVLVEDETGRALMRFEQGNLVKNGEHNDKTQKGTVG